MTNSHNSKKREKSVGLKYLIIEYLNKSVIFILSNSIIYPTLT